MGKTKAELRAEAFAVFHENLPVIIKFLRKANVIPKEK